MSPNEDPTGANRKDPEPRPAAGQQRAAEQRPGADRFVVGKLLEHGAAPHEFHRGGHASYYVKLLTDAGPRTVWAAGLKTAFERSRTQPQPGDQIGIRENNFDPISVVHRQRNREGVVMAERAYDSPRPHWVVEKLSDFDMRSAAARTLRDATVSRREAILSHPALKPAYPLLDTANKVAERKWESPDTRAKFVAAVRETLATHIERGEELPQLQPPERDQDRTRGA